MSLVAETTSMNVRRRQQLRVGALLDEIAARRQRLYVLKAYGARPAGLRTLKAELTAARDELAEVVDATTNSVREKHARREEPDPPAPSGAELTHEQAPGRAAAAPG
jgi:hypothetical protein